MRRFPLTPWRRPLCSQSLAGRRRWLVIALLWGLVTIISAGALAGIEITAVLSSSAEPYQLAAEGLRKQVTREGHTLLVRQLGDTPPILSSQPPDASEALFVAIGTPAATWLYEHLPPGVPLAYCLVSKAEPWGLESQRPTYGVSTEIPLKTQFSLIAEALPKTRRIGMLYYMDAEGLKRVDRIRKSLPSGWELAAVTVDQHSSFAEALSTLLERDVDVIWTELDPKVYNSSTVRSLLLAALRRRIPVFGYSAGFVRAGSLLGVGIDPEEQGRHVAELILRLLRRSDPVKVPWALREPVTPRHFIAVNSMVADKLAVRFPEAFRKRARVIVGAP